MENTLARQNDVVSKIKQLINKQKKKHDHNNERMIAASEKVASF